MPDPQPSAAAIRLIDAQDAAVREHLRSVSMPIGVTLTYERERSIRTLALDDAGVERAVEHLSALARLAYAEGEPDSNVWVRKTRLALAALTGDDDAK